MRTCTYTNLLHWRSLAMYKDTQARSVWRFLAIPGFCCLSLGPSGCEAGERALRSCPAAGCLSSSVRRKGRGSSPSQQGSRMGSEGCRELGRAGNPLPWQQGRKRSRQLNRRQSAEPPFVFSSLSFIPDSPLLFSSSFSFQSALLSSFCFPLHSSPRESQPAAALSQGNSSHPCVFLIALDPFNNERE